MNTNIENKRGPRWDWTINLGHVLVAISFAGPVLFYGLGFANDVHLMKADVSRHERTIEKIVNTQELSIQNQAAVTKLLDYHIVSHRALPK